MGVLLVLLVVTWLTIKLTNHPLKREGKLTIWRPKKVAGKARLALALKKPKRLKEPETRKIKIYLFTYKED